MKSHEYARKLLELPDVEVLIMGSDEDYYPAQGPEETKMHFGIKGPREGDYVDHYVSQDIGKCLRCERPEEYNFVTVVQLA